MAEETNNQEQIKPAAAKKAEKPPKLEEKPFNEFISQHYLPTLKEAMGQLGIKDVNLTFVQQGVPMQGTNSNEPCWQVVGKWQNGDRQFNIYFPDEDISGQKAFSSSTYSSVPSTLESFMIDEKRVNLELLVMYTIQRLNAQKWLTRN